MIFPLWTAAKMFLKDNPFSDQVYIAIIPDLDGNYNLEVEVSSGTVGLTYPTCSTSLNKARLQADQLEAILRADGVHVYKTRKEWESVEV